MFKVLCFLSIVAVVTAGMIYQSPSFPNQPRVVKREAIPVAQPEQPAKEAGVEAQDDMEKAETFGFGYHKVIHVYPGYYPSYGYGYPGYGYSYYGYPDYYHGYY